MIAQGTLARDVTPAQIAAVAQDADLFCKANKVARKAVAQAIGYSPSVVTEFLKGTYAGSAGQVAIDIEDWLVGEEQRRQNQQATRFVWTNVAMQIKSVADYCLDFKKVGLIYGPETSGLGKTTALKAIHQELGARRSALVTIDKVDSSPTGLLKKILNALHLDESGNNAMRMNRVQEYLTGRAHLLLIDQVHNLRFAKEDRPLYYLMDLYDSTKTAQLWCGTSDMVAYLQRQQARTTDEPLAQLRRRIFPCVDLMDGYSVDGGGERLYTAEQIREAFASFPLKLTPAAARWLAALACVPGSGALGQCVNLMECATMLGKQRRAPAIDVDLLMLAMRFGLTSARVNSICTKIDQYMDVQAKVA